MGSLPLPSLPPSPHDQSGPWKKSRRREARAPAVLAPEFGRWQKNATVGDEGTGHSTKYAGVGGGSSLSCSPSFWTSFCVIVFVLAGSCWWLPLQLPVLFREYMLHTLVSKVLALQYPIFSQSRKAVKTLLCSLSYWIRRCVDLFHSHRSLPLSSLCSIASFFSIWEVRCLRGCPSFPPFFFIPVWGRNRMGK